MKSVKKDFTKIPSILSSKACTDLQKDALNVTRGKHKFDSKIYGHPDVRKVLNKIYNNKCAFCETDPSAGMTIQVEHYRPKAKVTDSKKHPGYYWLGYEWSNLLLACSSCNNRKRNRFPLQNEELRKATPPRSRNDYLSGSKVLLGEQAQIINPELTSDMSIHFTYKKSGEIAFVSQPAKGTIERVNLNRQSLIKARKKILDKCLKGILKAFDMVDKRQIDRKEANGMIMAKIKDLVEIISENEPYSEYAKHCWVNFKPYIIDQFNSPQKEQVEGVYKRVTLLVK